MAADRSRSSSVLPQGLSRYVPSSVIAIGFERGLLDLLIFDLEILFKLDF